MPVIALYTGARLNEICQLYKRDIIKKQNIWCFSFLDDSDDKSIKNEPSKRIIPIPNALVELKFLEFIKKIPKGERLFSELRFYEQGGYGRDFSKWFSVFLDELRIIDKAKVFHSFRNNFINCQANKSTDEYLVNAIVGHANKTESYTTYLEALENMELLQEKINKVSFDI